MRATLLFLLSTAAPVGCGKKADPTPDPPPLTGADHNSPAGHGVPPEQADPLPKLGGPFDGGFHAILADGVTVFYTASLKPTDLQALLTLAGGEVCDPQPAEHALYAVPWSK